MNSANKYPDNLGPEDARASETLREIPAALQRQERAVASLYKTAQMLHERLAPVLKPAEPANPATGVAVDAAETSLGSSLEQTTGSIARTEDILRHILNDLAL